MEEKDKVTVAKTVNSWNALGNINQCVLLIGPSHTGRTIFAELVRKYYHNAPTPALAFDAAKSNYTLEGVISNKSIRIQTTYPALYEKSRKDKEEVKLVDVPCFIYAPDGKKWSGLEQKLTVDLMLPRLKNVGFLIFIEEKSTRTNITPWKKAVLGFLELFRPEALADEALLDSIGMAITKAPPETKEETMVARLKQIQATLLKDKHPLTGTVERIIKNVIDKSRIVIFKKVSGDQVQQEGIINAVTQLQKLANFKIDKNHFKEQAWPADGEKNILEYFINVVEPALKSLAAATKQLLLLADYSQDSLRKAKQKWREGGEDVVLGEELRGRMVQDAKGIKYLLFVQNYAKLASTFSNVTPSNLQELIEAIPKLGLFEIDDAAAFQTALEGLQFRRTQDFKLFEIDGFCNHFAELFSAQVRSEVFKKLALAESGNERKQFYEDTIQLIRTNFTEPPPALLELQEYFKKKLIMFANPKQALQLNAKELASEKNKSKQFGLACDVAVVLRKNGLLNEAGQVYRACRNVEKAMECLLEGAKSDQRAAMEYVNYLAELTLFEHAVIGCYDAAGRFGYDSREAFSQTLREVEAARRKYASEGMKNSELSLEIDISKVIQVANSSLAKL